MTFKKPLYLYFLLSSLFVLLLLVACTNNSGNGDKAGLSVSVTLPKRCLSQGQLFELEVLIQNNGTFNIETETILLPADFVTGSAFLGTQPAMPRTINAKGDWVFEFKRTIAPQGAEKLVFRFEAVATGSFEGFGDLTTPDGAHQFDLNISVAGVNPLGWKPGVAKPLPEEVNNEPSYLSVVKIDAVSEVNGQRMLIWSGSGTIISPDGLILTGSELVLSDRFFQIEELIVSLTVDENAPPVPIYQASIVQADFDLGLAIIKPRTTLDGKAIDPAFLNLPALRTGDSRALENGESLSVLGYPGLTKERETIKTSSLKINDFGSEFPFGEKVLIHAEKAIPSSYLGAPVLNEAGELLAVPIHKSPVSFDPKDIDCKALVDGNRDGRIDAFDACHRISLPIDTLRPIHLAETMIDAARRGELKIVAAGHGDGLLFSQAKLVELDDFSDNHNRWQVTKTESGEQGINDGGYFFEFDQSQSRLWSVVDYAYDDMLIETDIKVLEPRYDGEFGLLCGVNGENRTVFAVSENAYFAIWKVEDGEMRFLHNWQYSPAINTEENLRLTARCGLEILEFAVNGQVLARVVDDDFKPGLSGLYAASYEQSGLKVNFDNFSVSIFDE